MQDLIIRVTISLLCGLLAIWLGNLGLRKTRRRRAADKTKDNDDHQHLRPAA